MSELRTQLRIAQREHLAASYPVDLAADVRHALPATNPRVYRFGGAWIGIAAAAALLAHMLTPYRPAAMRGAATLGDSIASFRVAIHSVGAWPTEQTSAPASDRDQDFRLAPHSRPLILPSPPAFGSTGA